ncbi:hypothetical protein ASPWEDRAFT_25759 [Aspergillus wentii DTO 134E9]|uniref:Protein kinase domain-containing protein n=1 Tax=Aspergillus wentii DTO 134E9 TaxID=1073089 RepID=A0A1L9RYM1_ASPWE|nr:uncharacterized protein ASPWEDRAFT_25759 [Aspergillus wentii DTO 134E9]OJJ39974.1 hypothetical protein ASPWEDRAFT_25759 [Aspergillus wentii DTO 134E9]
MTAKTNSDSEGDTSRPTDYHHELEAIGRFAIERKYDAFFIKCLGWSVNQYMESPLYEFESQYVTSYIPRGLEVIHEDESAHGNLKLSGVIVDLTQPQNSSDSLVPELVGLIKWREEWALSFDLSADMWSVGEIALRLLTAKRPFDDLNTLKSYVDGTKTFPTKTFHEFGVAADAGRFKCGCWLQIPNTNWSSTNKLRSEEPRETVTQYVSRLASVRRNNSNKGAMVHSTLGAVTQNLPDQVDKGTSCI